MLLKAMSEDSEELVYAMGTDTPLSVLSEKPKLLFTYFKQRFAQVTNPPMDPIREDCNMSLQTYIAGKLNPIMRKEIYAKSLVLENPILTESEFSALTHSKKDLQPQLCKFWILPTQKNRIPKRVCNRL